MYLGRYAVSAFGCPSSPERDVETPEKPIPAWRLLTWIFVAGQAIALSATGLATLWWSSDLMTWLIYMVGEEYALGAENVISTEDGGKLLTNPGAMIGWTVPFWALGLLQISAAATMAWYRWRSGR